MLLNVLRCQLTYSGQAETNAEAWFNIALRPWKPERSLGQTAQDGHLDSHTAPELWYFLQVSFNLKVWMVWFKKQTGVVVYRLPFESVEGIVKHRKGTKKGEADVKEFFLGNS